MEKRGQVASTHFGKHPPMPKWLFKSILWHVAPRMLHRQVDGQGIGRHTAEEQYAIGMEDLEAISVLLGTKPYLMGDRPALVDLTLFGFVCMPLFVDFEDGVYKDAVVNKFPNLKAHALRIKEKFWPD